MHALAQFFLEFAELALHFLTHCLPLHCELPFSRLAAHVREAEEVEGLRLAFAPLLSVVGGKSAELNEARFVGMQFQLEAPQALRKFLLELLGVGAILESGNNVVSIAHDDDITAPCLPPPLVGPEVEHVMQIDIRQ